MRKSMSCIGVGPQCSVWLVCCCAVALWGNVCQGYFIDTFSGPGFDPRWTIESDTAAGQAPGFLTGGTVRFTNTFDHKFTLLRTSVDASPTQLVFQADVRNDDTAQSWSPGVIVYFNPTNYVALKLAPFGAAPNIGVFTHVALNGDPVATQATEVTPASLQYAMNTLRIVFDAATISFAVKRIGTDTDFVSLNSLTVARPANFFDANAQFILGKGFSSTSFNIPNFNNSAASAAAGGVNIIDNAMYIPEPGTYALMLMGIGGFLVVRKWKRP